MISPLGRLASADRPFTSRIHASNSGCLRYMSLSRRMPYLPNWFWSTTPLGTPSSRLPFLDFFFFLSFRFFLSFFFSLSCAPFLGFFCLSALRCFRSRFARRFRDLDRLRPLEEPESLPLDPEEADDEADEERERRRLLRPRLRDLDAL